MSSPRTFALVEAHLPACLSAIVRAYFQSRDRRPNEVAQAGEYETCMTEIDTNECLRGACQGGHLAIAELAISRGATNYPLANACASGNMAIVRLMLARMGRDWSHVLQYVNWNNCLGYACQGGHIEIAALMIERGADSCRYCRRPMAWHLAKAATIKILIGPAFGY